MKELWIENMYVTVQAGKGTTKPCLEELSLQGPGSHFEAEHNLDPGSSCGGNTA